MSRSQLSSTSIQRNRDNSRKNVEIEIHKVLYKQQTVFPSAKVSAASTAKEFTLKSGSYQYGFELKIPVRSSCGVQPSPGVNNNVKDQWSTTMSHVPIVGSLGKPKFSRNGVDFIHDATSHVETILPPSLSGMGEQASIKYFLKVTVNKASFLSINARDYHPFIFLPMDVPRLVDSARMAFVRRELMISFPTTPAATSVSATSSGNINGNGEPSYFTSGKKPSGLKKFFSNAFAVRPSSQLAITFEGRYSTSLDFAPLSPLPIQFFVVLKQSPDMMEVSTLYLNEFELELVATTVIRAHQEVRHDAMSLKFFQRSRLGLALDLSKAQRIETRGRIHWEIALPNSVMQGVQIPDSVCPTFITCNIERSYTLKIEAGFSCTPTGKPNYVQLFADIPIRSGIPSPGQLQRIPAPQYQPPATSSSSSSFPSVPPSQTSSYTVDAKRPEGPESIQQEQGTEEVPPSYEALFNSMETPSGRINRQYGQSTDYYTNLEES